MRAFFRGNGTNVIKIGPETALKLSLNDSIRSRVVRDPDNVQLYERMMSGALAGASAQVNTPSLLPGCAAVPPPSQKEPDQVIHRCDVCAQPQCPHSPRFLTPPPPLHAS